MSENDHGPEGHDPTEEVGPEGCEVDPSACEVAPGALDGPPEHAQVDFSEEVAEAFVAEPLSMIIDPRDGLPIPAEESSILSTAPPFSHDNVVCIEDARTFVELFQGEFNADDAPENFIVVNAPRYAPDGVDRSRMSFAPDRVITRWGKRYVQLSPQEWESVQQALQEDMPPGKEIAPIDEPPYVAVRPARERCRFYKRQVFSNDDQPDPKSAGHFIMFRNCTERRSVGGAFMSLRDQAVHACEYRDPPEPHSIEKHCDSKDRDRLNAVVTQVSLFNLDPNYVMPAAGVPMTPVSPGTPAAPPGLYVGVERVTAEPTCGGWPKEAQIVTEFERQRDRKPTAGALSAPQGPVEAPGEPTLYVGVEPVTRGPVYPPAPFPVSNPGGLRTWSQKEAEQPDATTAKGVMAPAPLAMAPHEEAHKQFLAEQTAREQNERELAQRACLPFPGSPPPFPEPRRSHGVVVPDYPVPRAIAVAEAIADLDAAEAAAEAEAEKQSAALAAAITDDSDTPKTPRNT